MKSAAILTLVFVFSLGGCRRAHTYDEFPSNLGARATADNARKRLTKFDGAIIDAHAQRGEETCVPSSVEMVLKLLERVPLSYYDQQDQWKTAGSFQNFDGKTFNDVTFRLQFWLPRDDNFPLERLFAVIHSELQEGRFVVIGLASDQGWHNWVIYDEDVKGEFLAVSKWNAKTIQIRNVKAAVTRMKGTDIGTYELQAH